MDYNTVGGSITIENSNLIEADSHALHEMMSVFDNETQSPPKHVEKDDNYITYSFNTPMSRDEVENVLIQLMKSFKNYVFEINMWLHQTEGFMFEQYIKYFYNRDTSDNIQMNVTTHTTTSEQLEF